MTVLTPVFLRKHFQLDWRGIHGAPHWARVAYNGRLLARELAGVNVRIVQAFALCHDLARVNERSDRAHGPRAVALLQRCGGADWLGFSASEFAELCGAIGEHTFATSGGTLTQQVCWDADRLDLWRIDIMPDPDRLFTEAARELHYQRLCSAVYCYGNSSFLTVRKSRAIGTVMARSCE